MADNDQENQTGETAAPESEPTLQPQADADAQAQQLAARERLQWIAAIVAGLLAATYPNLWLIDSLLFPEGLAALLATLCILVAYRWRDRPTWVAAAVLGALIGLAGSAFSVGRHLRRV